MTPAGRRSALAIGGLAVSLLAVFGLLLIARPGIQEIRVPLDAIERAPATRRNDLGAIRVLHLFVIEPKRVFSVYVDAFRLE